MHKPAAGCYLIAHSTQPGLVVNQEAQVNITDRQRQTNLQRVINNVMREMIEILSNFVYVAA